ncbi:phosphonate ABC transporter ATP-binding protein [Halospeciosus flavus]|uniref:Phosphonate ABC transporter ATP-binding protein n=1 Tax=Halospeciosus flavus TaxID=3032283 RepID=A0ABD5Z829_9EURY|nr:phosphonate ABC transporter ATP-binding protein [Halospeciosus flavus]
MPAVSVENLTKVYGDTVALDDVSFEVDEGDFVAVLGPSGAGKSTLLRILNGLADPTEGSVYIGDEEITGARSDIAMVFQQHHVIESMSAYRNALTGGLSRAGLLESLLAWNDESDKEAALEALDTVGLLEEAEQRTGSMSGGQQQRVGIARALVQQPSLLIADEPVASLDPKAAAEVMGYMRDAAKDRGLTTIASLHQVNIAREFGDYFVGIRDGEVVFEGSKEELTMEDVDRIYYEEDSETKRIET